MNLDRSNFNLIKRLHEDDPFYFANIEHNDIQAMSNTIVLNRIVKTPKTHHWCKIPYPNHPKGCQNFNHKKGCPPNVISIENFFDLSKACYFVFSEFDLKSHAEKMLSLHPNWTDRQCRCVLYWQNKNRSILKKLVKTAMRMLECNAVTYIPEAMGVNVYVTARINGLKLERIRDLNNCRHIAMIGTSKK